MTRNKCLFLVYYISLTWWYSSCKLPGQETLEKAKETIDKAVELGKQSPFGDTSIYPRVFENSQHDLYLNKRLVDFKQLDERIKNAKKQYPDGFILYANDTPATRIPTDSKILPILRATQMPVVLYKDSSFAEQQF